MKSTESLDRLKLLLAKLPGVGRRSAERLAVAMARNRDGYLGDLVATLQAVSREITTCSLCGAMTAVADASNGLSPEAARRLSAEISTHGLLAELASDKAVAHQAKEEAVRAPAIVAQGFLEYIGAVKVAAE